MAKETPVAHIADNNPPLTDRQQPKPDLSLAFDEHQKGGSDSGKSAAFIQPAVSFKEESNLVSDLSDSERVALDELITLLRQALDNNTLISPHPIEPNTKTEEKEKEKDENEDENRSPVEAFHRTPSGQVSIWGIPLLEDERSDVVLLKFLRARDFRVKDAFEMIGRTISWRVKFGVDDMVQEDEEQERARDEHSMEKVVFMHGHDREGHPVCYNVYGEFRDRDLYERTFSDEEKRRRFLKWRIRFLESNVRKLDFGPGGVSTLVQVNDLKGAPGPGRTELRIATRQALLLLQDNYPEFVAKQEPVRLFVDDRRSTKYLSIVVLPLVAWKYFTTEYSIHSKIHPAFPPILDIELLDIAFSRANNGICYRCYLLQSVYRCMWHLWYLETFTDKSLCLNLKVFINVPWWYIAFYAMLSPFMTQRTKSKFVFAGPARTADTLFKYISPEQVPIQYGGLSVDSCDCNPEFTMDDPATEVTIKPTTKQFVEILVSERCIIVWELRVVGWEVTYGAEFVPSSKDSYTVIIRKAKKMRPSDDPVISSRYKISEVGKIVLTIDNPSFKKRKLLYRYKVLPYTD
ncbi:Patellin-3-like protein [Drosera capensis]